MDMVDPHIDSYMAARLQRFDEPVLLEMEAEAAADEPPAGADILCPVCETRVQVDVGMECPNCGAPLEVG